MQNDSPSIRKIHDVVRHLIANGHPNVPGLLRRIAKDIEKNPPKPGINVHVLRTAKDEDGILQ